MSAEGKPSSSFQGLSDCCTISTATELGPCDPLSSELFHTQREVKGSEGRVYVLCQDVLGSGGYGVVYPAVEMTGRIQVAIKDVAGGRDRTTHLREASTLQRIEHLHIVRLFDIIELPSRQLIVMERLSGSLDDVLKRAG
eukprot:RCo054016